MEHIYERVKANSKFFKIIKEYAINPTGMATADGANAGTNPTQPQDPKVITANKLKADADKRAAQAELSAIQTKTNVDQKRVKELQSIIAGKPVQVPAK
jgi:hypothetical protein